MLAPDWDSTAADQGGGALRASLAEASRLAARHGDAPVVVVGWSLGGTAALSLALDAPAETGPVERWPAAIVGLAADAHAHSPLDGTVPADRVREPRTYVPPPIYLVHGRDDTVVPVAASVAFADACRVACVPCSFEVVATDHAGVVGTVYDPVHRICISSDDASAVNGLAAAVRAVDAALAGQRNA